MAPRFCEGAIDQSGEPESATTDKSDSAPTALHALNAERERWQRVAASSAFVQGTLSTFAHLGYLQTDGKRYALTPRVSIAWHI